ncbi:MAG: HAMP domain-containing sensor histidine kinase [Minwuia sp.]|nr:HAMP domain-containing sensor histidine kinase [Minwuia sp.]
MRRKIRFVAVTIMTVTWPLTFVDFLNLGFSSTFILICCTRGVELLSAVGLFWVTRKQERSGAAFVLVFTLGMAVFVQTLINAMLYQHILESVLLQQLLVGIFALIYYPLPLRLVSPVVFGLFAISIMIFSGEDTFADPELGRMTIWGTAGLILGLYTARQLNRAERLNFLELHKRDLAEEQLVAARTEAESANRAKSEFLANMSHELRTPLNAVIGFSEMMSHKVFGPLGNSRYEEYANDIGTSGRHLLSLIDEVLDFTKIEAGRQELTLQWLDLGLIANAVSRMLAPQAIDAQIRVSVHTAEEPVMVLADDRAVRQILLNLASNAIKFTHPGGQIDITINRTPDGAGIVIVQDTGVGIPDSEMERILRPFEQVEGVTTRSKPGWGLGLSIVSLLVRLHGAAMQIDSQHGEGTQVSITFPIPDPAEDQTRGVA